jgi:hypothetical protein
MAPADFEWTYGCLLLKVLLKGSTKVDDGEWYFSNREGIGMYHMGDDIIWSPSGRRVNEWHGLYGGDAGVWRQAGSGLYRV